ncbi:baseplate wedge subunit [Aeromonas phage AsFcp_4]|uniref:Gp25 baseplate wedge subunit n=1 Tax=Aeromonas phage PX29 TaxID=926067 RepID=E5DQC6_9CAUD|nr:baseplate wedge subunit [Aeromonas phage PX29]ADQ52912.1 gp25 baseplate wedge subunit [Aeromonas phage PX29]QAX98454.1 baseplate wedge subunit [Aeromonas phage AsFcp_2]QAX99486.1 baseplate wedge subunit [Aeromonas phage AsFcp_4]
MSAFGNRLRMLAVESKQYYSDIDAMMGRDFRDNDIVNITNVSAVQQSMAGIIGTRRGERPFDPNFGCDIHNSLFENMNEAAATAIERSIYDAIGNYEPRVRMKNVSVVPIYDRNEYVVTLYYRLITDLNYLYELKMGVTG